MRKPPFDVSVLRGGGASQRPASMRLTSVAAGLMLFLVADPLASSSVVQSKQDIVVTSDDRSLPQKCRPRALASALVGFMDALRTGDDRKLRGYFGAGFKWFSVTGSPVRGHRRHFVAYEVEKAVLYIVEKRGFRWTLSDLVVSDNPRGYSDIHYSGVWSYKGARWSFRGKGAIDCGSRVVKVWSLAVSKEQADRGDPLCPAPAEAPNPNTLVACVRQS